MRRKQLTVLVITFLVASCQSGDGERYVVSDVIADFDIALKETMPSSVSFKDGVYDRRRLAERVPTRGVHLYAAGQQSKLSFFAYQDASLELQIRCRPVKLIGLDDTPQSFSIFLNSNEVSTIDLNPDWSEYQVELPAELLRPGENLLRFEYEHTGTPAEVSDRRGKGVLSVAFSDISVSDPTRTKASIAQPIQKVDGKILQRSDSVLIYYAEVPNNSRLQLEIEGMGKEMEAHISVESEDVEPLEVVLDGQGPAVVDLSGFSDQVVKLTFHAKRESNQRNSPEESVEWSQIQIVTLDGRKNKISIERKEERKKRRMQKFDVFYVVLDAFCAKHASLYGYHRETTPFLEQLGKESVVFDNFFSHSAYTLASTGTLLTSKYPHRHGLTVMKGAIHEDLLNLPKALTAGDVESYLISDHTFLTGDLWGLNRDYTKLIMKGSYENSLEEVVEALNAVYLEKNGENRKFVYLHLIPPHRPYDPPEEFRIFTPPGVEEIDITGSFLEEIKSGTLAPSEKELDYIESMYDANVLYADSIVKGIYEYLRSKGRLDRTILIVTSDHGEASRMEHGELGHNTTLYDEMIHVPFLVRLPDTLGQKHRRLQSLAGIIDVAPTILDLFGIKPVEEFEGLSLLGLITGDDTEVKSYLFLENPGARQVGIRGENYKYISTFQRKMLFDLRDDPGERQDLYSRERIVSGYYEQLVTKEYTHLPIVDTQEEDLNLDGLSDEQKQKLRELGYIR